MDYLGLYAKTIANAAIVFIVFFSIIIHEVSHGLAAYWLGDDTAKRMGRLKLNPIYHIDWLGTVIIPLVLYLTSGFVFGYAKPVPINPYNFANFKRDSGLTAIAGPLSNFLIAIAFALVYHLVGNIGIIGYICSYVIMLNLILALFNLLPFPPLDGSKVLGMFLSDNAYYKWTLQEKRGMQILMGVLLVSYLFHWNIFGRIIFPIVQHIMLLLGIG